MPNRMNKHLNLGAIALATSFYLISTGPSYAYLDPGTGSMILTAILGFIAATTYTLKGYLSRFKMLFRTDEKDSERHDGDNKG